MACTDHIGAEFSNGPMPFKANLGTALDIDNIRREWSSYVGIADNIVGRNIGDRAVCLQR